jgi:DtxR family transcriptional regulator, Mn-dependent transcriptional regulator
MASPRTGAFHQSYEEYCEAIFELHEDELDVIQARIAERLSVSRPSVSEMMKRLEAEGLVDIGANITLTEKGRELAESVVRRHRLAERFLTDVLQLSWADAHVEAGKWEHVISPVVEAAMTRMLGEPTTCPHGNPIPGSDYHAENTRQLHTVDVGATFTVRRIPEELEFAPGMLDYLEQVHVLPGRTGVVRSADLDGVMLVEIDGRDVELSAFASERLLVTIGD